MKYWMTILTALLIAVLSLMPAQEFPQVEVPFADKWTHCVMYGFMTMVMLFEHGGKQFRLVRTNWSIHIIIILIASFWGGLMELLQALCTTTRSGEFMDFVANALGAVIVIIIYRIITLK